MSSRAVRDEDVRSATGIPALISRTLSVVGGVILIAGLVVALPGQAVAATGDSSGTVITMFSQPGDNIDNGVPLEFDSSNSTIVSSSSLSTSAIWLVIADKASGSQWRLEARPRPGATFEAGYYGNAVRDVGFVGRPVLDVSWDNRGCNTVAGSFEIRDLLSSASVITRLDLLYEQHCDGASAASWGEVRVNEPLTSGLVVSSQSIDWPAAGVGASGTAVPVYVRNLGDADTVLGSAGIAGDQPEFSIRSDGCSGQTLPPGGACALDVAFAPATTRGPRTGRLQLRLGGAVDSVQLDGLVSVGTTSLVMRSQPGDYVGQGLDYDFTASNAASTFGGGPYGISAWVTSGSEWWGVDMTPARDRCLWRWPVVRRDYGVVHRHPGRLLSGRQLPSELRRLVHPVLRRLQRRTDRHPHLQLRARGHAPGGGLWADGHVVGVEHLAQLGEPDVGRLPLHRRPSRSRQPGGRSARGGDGGLRGVRHYCHRDRTGRRDGLHRHCLHGRPIRKRQ